jgi:hypothetical protein
MAPSARPCRGSTYDVIGRVVLVEADVWVIGFTEHLAKPLTPDRVMECIERLCPLAR